MMTKSSVVGVRFRSQFPAVCQLPPAALMPGPALSALIGAANAVWQVGVLRAGAWAARGLRVPARNALLADLAPQAALPAAQPMRVAMPKVKGVAFTGVKPKPRRR